MQAAPETTMALKAQLHAERKVQDELREELRLLKRNIPLVGGEDEEKKDLIEELHKLEKENELMKEEEIPTVGEMRMQIFERQQEYSKVLGDFKRELKLFEGNFSHQQKELKGLNSEVESVEKEIASLDFHIAEWKEVVMLNASDRESAQELFKLKYQWECDQIGHKKEDEMHLEDMEELVTLLKELSDEYFVPKEKERQAAQIKENQAALEKMFADMAMD